ncbi:MAG: DUF465 domain-containing protein [Sulfitobacter sp.]|nr:DUF465 domain-containing protein [Sulfitobacter sp.]
MSHVPHELNQEFPDHVDAMTKLRLEDAHFAKLSERYHRINRAVHRAETDVEPTTDDHLIEMRKERLALKDEIYGMLK